MLQSSIIILNSTTKWSNPLFFALATSLMWLHQEYLWINFPQILDFLITISSLLYGIHSKDLAWLLWLLQTSVKSTSTSSSHQVSLWLFLSGLCFIREMSSFSVRDWISKKKVCCFIASVKQLQDYFNLKYTDNRKLFSRNFHSIWINPSRLL